MENSQNSEHKFRQYNPLPELNNPYLRIYNIPTSPELLFDHEARTGNRRTLTESILKFSGSAYLLGTFSGAVKGAVDSLRSAEPRDSAKIRLSRVLNSGGLAGRRLGNSLGIMGLIFPGLEGVMLYKRDTDDLWNTVVAGLGTGAIYRAASGPKSAAVAAVIGGFMAAAAAGGKQAFKRFVPT